MAVESRLFEHVKQRLFNDYLLYSIFAIQVGDDNGFRAGAYIDFKLKPYMEKYLERMETQVCLGWNVRAMPMADIILGADIMAHQAVWEYNNATSYSVMRPGDWDMKTTFIFMVSDENEYSIKTAEGFRRLVERHYTIDGCWYRLIAKDLSTILLVAIHSTERSEG